MAMVIIMPLSSDLYAAGKKKKKKGTATATLPAPKKVSPYEKLLKGKNVETSKSNFITLHKVGNKLYFEIPLKYMNREILLASTVTNVTSPEFCDMCIPESLYHFFAVFGLKSAKYSTLILQKQGGKSCFYKNTPFARGQRGGTQLSLSTINVARAGRQAAQSSSRLSHPKPSHL